MRVAHRRPDRHAPAIMFIPTRRTTTVASADASSCSGRRSRSSRKVFPRCERTRREVFPRFFLKSCMTRILCYSAGLSTYGYISLWSCFLGNDVARPEFRRGCSRFLGPLCRSRAVLLWGSIVVTRRSNSTAVSQRETSLADLNTHSDGPFSSWYSNSQHPQ